jgi:hypothetical protein
LTVDYFGVAAIALSIVSSKGLNKPTLGHLATYGALSVVGCLVYHAQIAYHGWKDHYLDCLRTYIGKYDVKQSLLPDFLLERNSPERLTRPARLSADQNLARFSLLVTAGTTALFVWQWLHLWHTSWAHLVAGALTVGIGLWLAGPALRFNWTTWQKKREKRKATKATKAAKTSA